MSVQTAPAKRKDMLGPVICSQCRQLVTWVRKDGGIVLVNAGNGKAHQCPGRAA